MRISQRIFVVVMVVFLNVAILLFLLHLKIHALPPLFPPLKKDAVWFSYMAKHQAAHTIIILEGIASCLSFYLIVDAISALTNIKSVLFLRKCNAIKKQ